LRNSNAAYVLLGIPEDIGVRVNLGYSLNDESTEKLISYLVSNFIEVYELALQTS